MISQKKGKLTNHQFVEKSGLFQSLIWNNGSKSKIKECTVHFPPKKEVYALKSEQIRTLRIWRTEENYQSANELGVPFPWHASSSICRK
jgi:hypothetical protein